MELYSTICLCYSFETTNKIKNTNLLEVKRTMVGLEFCKVPVLISSRYFGLIGTPFFFFLVRRAYCLGDYDAACRTTQSNKIFSLRAMPVYYKLQKYMFCTINDISDYSDILVNNVILFWTSTTFIFYNIWTGAQIRVQPCELGRWLKSFYK